MNYICSRCGKKSDTATLKAGCECGGLWKLDYKPPKFDLDKVDQREWSLFRYRAFMPPEGEVWRDITLGEGMTPVTRFNDDILLKMDYEMPTLSFKDRGAAVLISHCKTIGVEHIVQDSSGNAGNSVAAYAARAGISCEIFVPEGTSPKKIAMIRAHGATCTIVPGSRDHCAAICREKASQEGNYYASHVYNPFFYEGTKTYIYEVYEQLGRIPANIIVPVGNGTLFLGVMKGLEELAEAGLIERFPQVIAVQSERCAPLLEAVKNSLREPVKVSPQKTLAEGIAIGEPMRGREILEYIYRHGVKMVSAPEEKILEARGLLAAKGIYCEHTTAANLAGYMACAEMYGVPQDCLIPICGAGLKSDH